MTPARWIVLFAPLLVVAVIAIAAQALKKLSSYLSVAAVAVSFFFSLLVFGSSDQDVSFNWIDLGSFQIRIGYMIDSFSKTMLFIVSAVGLVIHSYSLCYMHDDRCRSRYFARLSPFTFSLLRIFLANH